MNQNKTLKGWLSIILNSSYFLDKIYISWHEIKEKEICDPMEKIWVKRPFKLKVMNLWTLHIFWILFLIFQDFLEFLKAKKCKNVWDVRGADVTRHGHVAMPRELTRTHAGAYVALRINRAKHIDNMQS